jgi:sporulation protein YlmC with PRC-barrel domain
MWRFALVIVALAAFAEAQAQDDMLRVDEVIGMEVVTPEGRPLGRITDLLAERDTGKVERVAVGSTSYPVSALLSADRPGQVVLELPFGSSGGASAFLQPAGTRLAPVTREFGPAEALSIDLRDGRVQRGRERGPPGYWPRR